MALTRIVPAWFSKLPSMGCEKWESTSSLRSSRNSTSRWQSSNASNSWQKNVHLLCRIRYRRHAAADTVPVIMQAPSHTVNFDFCPDIAILSFPYRPEPLHEKDTATQFSPCKDIHSQRIYLHSPSPELNHFSLKILLRILTIYDIAFSTHPCYNSPVGSSEGKF